MEQIDSVWFAVVNPHAGSGKTLSLWKKAEAQMRRRQISYGYRTTDCKSHATEIAYGAAKEGFRKFIAAGGDGTVHEMLNGIMRRISDSVLEGGNLRLQDFTLAVIPIGSGNDWIRMFGISKTYSEAVRSLVEKKTVLQDVGKVSYYQTRVNHIRYMANVSGLGYDAVVNLKYNKMKDNGRYGKWLYLLCALQTFLGCRSKRFSIKADGRDFYKGLVFSGAVGIGKYNGGGMQQTPYALFDDGLMDMTVIRKMSKLKIMRKFKCLYSGNIYAVPGVMHLQAKKIEIETWPESRIEIDGEAVGNSPFCFELVPHGIRVVVGPGFVVPASM